MLVSLSIQVVSFIDGLMSNLCTTIGRVIGTFLQRSVLFLPLSELILHQSQKMFILTLRLIMLRLGLF